MYTFHTHYIIIIFNRIIIDLGEFGMGLSKQAKVLSKSQIESVRSYLRSNRNGLRNETIFLLSVKSGLRSKEISGLRWIHLLKSDITLDDSISLPNDVSKGSNGGRIIPIHKDLKKNLELLFQQQQKKHRFDPLTDYVIPTERSSNTSPQMITNFFHSLYRKLGMIGCSSHSGRRTFITEVARKISTVGGSLRDVQYLAGHSSLQTTQRYIEGSSNSRSEVIRLI